MAIKTRRADPNNPWRTTVFFQYLEEQRPSPRSASLVLWAASPLVQEFGVPGILLPSPSIMGGPSKRGGEFHLFFARLIVRVGLSDKLIALISPRPNFVACQDSREQEHSAINWRRVSRRRTECQDEGSGLGAARKMFSTLRTGFCHPIWRKAEGAPKEEVRQEGSMVKVCDTYSGAVGPSSAGEFGERGETRLSREPRKGGGDAGTALIPRTRTLTRRPHMYRVLLLNDDYTTQEFVIIVLRKYFNKSVEEATRIMLLVHNHGVGECGVYTYEVAETKVTQVMDFARKHQHPLQCIMEKK
jgi:ATP-dependent Clp protease adaptor protein ClpS